LLACRAVKTLPELDALGRAVRLHVAHNDTLRSSCHEDAVAKGPMSALSESPIGSPR
jgi:hypothetical protein